MCESLELPVDHVVHEVLIGDLLPYLFSYLLISDRWSVRRYGKR